MVVNSVSLLQIGYYLLLQSNQTVIHHLYTPPFESKLIFELSKKQNFIKIFNKNVISALQRNVIFNSAGFRSGFYRLPRW